jgi:hypothetical protein
LSGWLLCLFETAKLGTSAGVRLFWWLVVAIWRFVVSSHHVYLLFHDPKRVILAPRHTHKKHVLVYVVDSCDLELGCCGLDTIPCCAVFDRLRLFDFLAAQRLGSIVAALCFVS